MRPSSVVMRTRICLPMPAAHDDSGVDGASGMASGIAPTPVIFIERRPCYPGSAVLTTSRGRGSACAEGEGRNEAKLLDRRLTRGRGVEWRDGAAQAATPARL